MRPATFLQSVLILSTLIFFHISPVSCQTITDLDANDSTNFPNQVSSWNVGGNGLVSGASKWSFCSNLYLLGGYNILNTGGTFYKTFSGLATPHTMILFSMTVQIIDTWDGASDNDRFTVSLDGTVFTSYTFTYPSTGTSLCGLPSCLENGPLQYVINMGHTSASLAVIVTSLLSSAPSDESFGFRDIKITPYTPTTTVANSGCFIADYSLAATAYCPCPTYPTNPIAGSPNGYFQSPSNSGQCLPCDSTCTQCLSASSSNCQACAPNRYLSGSSCPQCVSSCLTCNGGTATSCLTCEIGKFLAMDKSCIGSCPSPLVQTSTTTGTYIELCNSPCYSTPSTKFLYWDSTCNPYCAAPLTTVYVAPYYLCNYTCQVYEFMYWDMPGVYCSQQCNFPLAQNTTHGRQFCNFPCTDQTDYLYWDGSCHPSSACQFPLIGVTNLSRKFCYYPCTAGKYLYFNQSCLSTCEPPFVIVIDGNATYCNYPCAVTQVAYWDGSCNSSCPSPFILKSEGSPLVRYYCTFQCDIDEFLYWNGTCSDACPPPLKYQYFISRSLCQYPCNTASQYLLYDGTCVSSCNYPLYTHIEGGVKLCENTCPSTQYLYWNGTCSDTCNSPLLPRTNGGAHFCDFPCTNTAYFLYWNGTCSATCPLPYSQKLEGSPERKYCEYVCNSNNEYQYFNGSCQDTCTTPYSPRVTNGLKYCDYVCTGISPSIYLYWDGTCLPTCNDPLKPRADGTAEFCEFPCESQSQFLYWNGTCSDFCMPPLSSVTQGSGGYVRNFCDFGCNSGEYLYWDGSCQTSCGSPFISKTEGTENFCLAPCDSVFDYYYPDSETCKQGCEDPYSIDTNVNYQRCLSPDFVEEGWFYKHVLTPPDGEGKVSFVTVGKLTPHISYLDINMPPRLEAFVASRGRNLFDIRFGSQMSQSMRADFPNYSIPNPFEAQGLYSNFLVNFWKDFSSFYISILIAIGLTICEKAAKILNWITLHACFERLSNIARWNLLLILLTTSVGDVFLFSVLHFRSFSLSGTIDGTILGLLVATVSIIGAGALIAGSIWLVKKAQASQAMSMSAKERSKDEAMKFIKAWQNYQIVFRGFRKNGKLTQFFYAIYIVRLALPKLIAAAFYGLLPMLQPILQLVVSLLITGYIIITGPLLKRINKIQLLVVELITLAINVCVLVLAVFEKVGVDTSNKFAVFVGDFIIASSFVMNVLLIIFLVFKLMNGVNFIWAKSKAQKTQNRAQWPQWLQLLALPVQQTGMGFEEMMDFDPRYDDFATDSGQGTQLPELEKIRKNNRTALDSTIGNISERGLLRPDVPDTKREHSISTLSYYENRFDDVNQGKKQNPFSHGETEIKKNPNFESPEFGYARPEQTRTDQLDVEDLSPLKNFAGAPQAKFKKFPRQDL